MEEMTELAVRLAKDGKIDGERIDDSVRRILTLKKKYGILGQTDYSVTEEEADAAVKGVGSDENRETAWDITEKALTLVKNENEAFPVKAKAGQSALILFADSCASRAGAGEFAKQILTEKGFYPEGTDYSVMVYSPDNTEECVQAAVGADHLILVHSMYDAGNLDPDSEDGLPMMSNASPRRMRSFFHTAHMLCAKFPLHQERAVLICPICRRRSVPASEWESRQENSLLSFLKSMNITS